MPVPDQHDVAAETVAAVDRRQTKSERTQQIITLVVVILIVLSFALLVYSIASGATDPKDAIDMRYLHDLTTGSVA